VRALEAHVGAVEDMHRVLAAPLGTSAGAYLQDTGLFDEEVDVRVHGRFRLARALRAAAGFRRWAVANQDRILAIHANGMPEMAVAWTAAAALGVPLVVWAHGVEVPRFVRWLAPVWRRPTVDVRWAAVSHAAATKILASGVAVPDRMSVVPNPIDPAAVLASHPHDSDTSTLAFLGGGSTRKGFDMLAGLLEDLSDVPVRLLTAGSLPKDGDEHWEALLRHGDRVVTMGGLDDVREIYGAADIVLMPSRQESFGRVAAEAMMNGLPVVAFDIPALREVVGDGEGGLLVPLDDQVAFNGAVRSLIERPELRRRMAETGRARAEAFVPSRVSQALCRLYGPMEPDEITQTG